MRVLSSRVSKIPYGLTSNARSHYLSLIVTHVDDDVEVDVYLLTVATHESSMKSILREANLGLAMVIRGRIVSKRNPLNNHVLVRNHQTLSLCLPLGYIGALVCV